MEINLTDCKRKGPASARNKGVEISKGSWILFLDSDCLATENTLKGYLRSCNNSVAYAGMVKSFGRDLISQYYEAQEILMPLKIQDEKGKFVRAGFSPLWSGIFYALDFYQEGVRNYLKKVFVYRYKS